MIQKKVKIIGLSVNENFGTLKAVNLAFDKENRLTVIKGEVGSGKTTLQRALKLTSQGSNTLEDKKLLGQVDIVTQLLDGDTNIFVGCKSKEDGSLDYFIYSTDVDGKKIKDVVLDGKKLTPASYLKSLQTALTWRLNELTSENSTVQRDILLELYQNELELKGVIFDKSNAFYVDSIIDKIEKAKNQRNFLDMKRKEVGGIADDLNKKGIDYSERRKIKEVSVLEEQVGSLRAKKQIAIENPKLEFENKSNEIKLEGKDIAEKIRIKNDAIKQANKEIDEKIESQETEVKQINIILKGIEEQLQALQYQSNYDLKVEFQNLKNNIIYPAEIKDIKLKEFDFNDTGNCISKVEDFEDEECKKLILSYRSVALKYQLLKKNYESKELNTDEIDIQISVKEKEIQAIKEFNKDCIAVNSYHDWKEQNEFVKSLNKDYFMKLTEIETGVEGLYICPEYSIDENGEKIAKGNDIYLMYDGSYDPEYFNNQEKEIRKLASYSDTQKPMICILIQKYLLSKKSKALPYLWIDNVPIDNKTKKLLDNMAQELDLWLFVNWTGDFSKETLVDGEILIENGEVFLKD